MNRRDFLKRAINLFFLILAITILSVIVVYIYPTKIKNRKLNYIYLMDEDELPRNSVRKVEFGYKIEDKIITNRVFVVATKGVVTAFSPVCTHLGCLVNWDNNKKEFLCPCHGGRFNMNGDVLGGPPPRPLTRLPLEIKDGKVYVGIRV